MGTLDGVLVLRKGESLVEEMVDFGYRHEIADGQTISVAPTITVVDADGSSSSHLTISAVALAAGDILGTAGSAVTFKVTVTSDAVEGADYEIVIPVLLSGGATIKECLGVTVEKC